MRIGTGWLGWTEAQVLDTSMDVIESAYWGRIDMVQMIKNGGPPPPPASSTDKPRSLTPELFDVLFGR